MPLLAATVTVPAQASPAATQLPSVALQAAGAVAKPHQLKPGRAIKSGDVGLRSRNGDYRMVVQKDGNLVVYKGSKAIFNTMTMGKGASRISLQPDGNLVLRNGNGPTWTSKTAGKGAVHLVLSDGGNLILYTKTGKAVWTSNAELAARKKASTPTPKTTNFYLPFPAGKSYRISQGPGGSTSHNYGNSKYAIDFAMPTGSTVVATKSGTVQDTKWTSGGGGMSVLVNHGNNLCSYYAHLSGYAVTPGQQVSTGQKIAVSGATGNATGPHLHFSLVYCNTYGAAQIVKTAEMGTSYPQGAMATSQND